MLNQQIPDETSSSGETAPALTLTDAAATRFKEITKGETNPEIGLRNLETLVAATLEATLLHPTKSAPKAFLDAAAEISGASMAAYRALVYETPGFTDYFFSATPIREIAELNIGHAIVAHALMVGFAAAVREMKRLMVQARR